MLARSTPRTQLILTAAVALGLATALGACGSSTTHARASTTPTAAKPHVMLDTARVALAITQSIKADKHLAATVVCPPNVPQQQGHTFTCVATTHSRFHGKRVPVHTLFTVSQTNSAGNVSYQSPQ